jgi:hypothetical protein
MVYILRENWINYLEDAGFKDIISLYENLLLYLLKRKISLYRKSNPFTNNDAGL